MRDYEDRQRDWHMRQDEKAEDERVRSIQLGVVRGKANRDIKTTDSTTVRIDHVGTLKFRSAVEIKKGDTIKVTIEKVTAEQA